jgi:hypothetical protein
MELMTLRIHKSDEGESTVFTLTGRIRVEQVEELQTLFKSGSRDHNIVLDLKEVRLIDQGAVRFLAHREAEGMRLRNCPAYIREWILREGKGNKNIASVAGKTKSLAEGEPQ